jgi:hypothetical protein
MTTGPTLPPLCRPAGWIALWRRMGNLSILNQKVRPFP